MDGLCKNACSPINTLTIVPQRQSRYICCQEGVQGWARTPEYAGATENIMDISGKDEYASSPYGELPSPLELQGKIVLSVFYNIFISIHEFLHLHYFIIIIHINWVRLHWVRKVQKCMWILLIVQFTFSVHLYIACCLQLFGRSPRSVMATRSPAAAARCGPDYQSEQHHRHTHTHTHTHRHRICF